MYCYYIIILFPVAKTSAMFTGLDSYLLIGTENEIHAMSLRTQGAYVTEYPQKVLYIQ